MAENAPSPQAFRSRLELLMKGSALSQTELAARLETTQPAVSQWLTGKKMPARETVGAIAKQFEGVTAEWLEFGGGRVPDLALRVGRDEYREKAVWRFRPQPRDGGRDYGNANVWSLDPDSRTLVRESGQNTKDAAGNTGVEMIFRVIRLRGSALQAFLAALKWDELAPHIKAASENKQKLGQLLGYALEQFDRSKELLLLRVEDRGASGLTGPEDGGGKFAALARNNLDSEKESQRAGGSFGLGKAVFWRASLFATVLFNSDLTDLASGQHGNRVIGRADLPFHESYAGPGWFGELKEGRTESYWENAALAHDLFLGRESGRTGTSILVLGFHDPSADVPKTPRQLADEIEAAAAESFWPAISEGTMTVNVETAEGTERLTSITVGPEHHVPEFVDALDKHRRNEVVDQLKDEGDVARRMLPLNIPRRISKLDPHDALSHQAALLVRRAGEEDEGGTAHRLALLRGTGMVVRYLDLRNLSIGGRPFHAVLLCGEAAGSGPVDVAAETFLRTAEPPAHDRWTSTPDLKTQYAPGGKVAIERLINEAKDAIRELVRPSSRDLSDGPRALKELFKMGTPTATTEHVRVVAPKGHVDELGRWEVESTIRVRPDGRAWRMRPVLLFAAETGAGLPVEWENLEPLAGCTLDPENRLLIPSGVREARFRGRSDPRSHPVPALESTVTVDVRSVERLNEVPA